MISSQKNRQQETQDKEKEIMAYSIVHRAVGFQKLKATSGIILNRGCQMYGYYHTRTIILRIYYRFKFIQLYS